MTQAEGPLNKSTILGLAAMALAVLVVANDFTALSVALPAMEQEFGADVTTVQWVINGYALVFGVLIVTGGRLADMFGRRRIFFLGASLFAVFSVIGGFAPNVGVLLACRGLMGVGGAMMWPAILGMTYAILPQSKAGLAGGLILGAAGFGNAIGPLIGGALTDALSWRWIFFLNLPIAAFAMLVTWRVVRADEGTLSDHRIDYGGVIFLSIGLLALLFALDEGIDLGWSRSSYRRSVRTCRRSACRIRIDRAARRHDGACAQRCAQESRLPPRVHGSTDDVGDFLRRAALPATVHDQSAPLFCHGVGRGLVADDGYVCRDVLRGRAALRTNGS